MEIWLDTADLSAIAEAKQLGILHGVTTNPLIVAESKKPLEQLLDELLNVQSGPVTAQVTSREAKEMIVQGQAIHKQSDRLIVKIPVTREGLFAIHALSKEGVPIMATAVFNSTQCLLAARAGASYLAPYYSRICENDMEGHEIFRAMVDLLRRYHYPSKILAASIQTPEQVEECARIGVDAVTLKKKTFEETIEDHPLTLKALSHFEKGI